MIRGLYTSSAGMQVEALRQEAIANNLANVNTVGFKRDLAVMEARANLAVSRLNDPVGPEIDGLRSGTPIGELGTGVVLDRVVKRFEEGNLIQTDAPLDFALAGEGFFSLSTPGGETLYTRAGDFTRDAQGVLVDKLGRGVMGQGGPVTLPPGEVTVGADGGVFVNGQMLDRFAIVRFANPDDDLEKLGDAAFRYRGEDAPQPATAQVLQGKLEGSNVNGVREMVEMIAVVRQYEANQKAISHQDETLAKAVNEVARG